MRGDRNTHPTTHLFFCQKLREYSARSYWSTAEPCENWQPTSIYRHAERTGIPLLFVDRRIIEGFQQISYPVSRAYTMQNSEVWFHSLDDEPIRGSHFSSFLHILPLKLHNCWISMKSMKTQIILHSMLVDKQFFSNFYLHWFFSNLPFFERDPHMDSPEAIWVNPNSHTVLFIHNRYWWWGASVILTPPPPTHLFFCRNIREYSAVPIGWRPSLATIGKAILLVDMRREPITCFYLSTGWSLRGFSGSHNPVTRA